MKNLLKNAFEKRLIFGIAFLIISLTPFIFITKTAIGIYLALFHLFYDVGVVLVCDHVIESLSGESLIIVLSRNRKNQLIYFGIGALAGLLLDGFSNYLGGLWFYPFWSNELYLSLFLLGFPIYFLTVIFSYQAAKLFLDKITEKKKKVTRCYKYEGALYKILLFLGIVAFLFVYARVLYNTNFFRNFQFSINTIKEPYLEFGYIILMFFSVWFIAEFVEYKRKNNSLIKNTLHGYFNPLLAIIISSIILAIYMEVQNLPLGLWIYSNWPWQEIEFLGLPVMVYIAWPLHYIGLLSGYRALGNESSQEIFAGDMID